MFAICFLVFASSAHVPNVPWPAAMETHTKAAQYHLMKIRKYQERLDFHIKAAGKSLELAEAGEAAQNENDKAATANKVAKKNRKIERRRFARQRKSARLRYAEAAIEAAEREREAAEETAALRTAEAVLLGNDTAIEMLKRDAALKRRRIQEQRQETQIAARKKPRSQESGSDTGNCDEQKPRAKRHKQKEQAPEHSNIGSCTRALKSTTDGIKLGNPDRRRTTAASKSQCQTLEAASSQRLAATGSTSSGSKIDAKFGANCEATLASWGSQGTLDLARFAFG